MGWASIGTGVLVAGAMLMVGLTKQAPAESPAEPYLIWGSLPAGLLMILLGAFLLKKCDEVVIALRPEGLIIKDEALIKWIDIAHAGQVCVRLPRGWTNYLAVELTRAGLRNRKPSGNLPPQMENRPAMKVDTHDGHVDVAIRWEEFTSTPIKVGNMITQRAEAAKQLHPET
ncbi:MAG: hypothetical protein HN350_08575 [Phycisphaerales bacterium]|nr:hypothetical protein [Phycisphaerales bacterium]